MYVWRPEAQCHTQQCDRLLRMIYASQEVTSSLYVLGLYASKWLLSSYRYLQSASENSLQRGSDLVELTAQYTEKI